MYICIYLISWSVFKTHTSFLLLAHCFHMLYIRVVTFTFSVFKRLSNYS